MSKCIIDGCERKARTRGLCQSCYQSALWAIKAGKATWESLEAAGFALPATRANGGGNPTPFRRAFEAQATAPPQTPPDASSGQPTQDPAPQASERGVGYPAPYNVEPADGSIYPPAPSTSEAAPPWAQ